jgi:hypothetical protein
LISSVLMVTSPSPHVYNNSAGLIKDTSQWQI